MDNKDLSNLGKEIQNIVQDAVGSMDFHKLNKDIGDTVNSAISEVKKTVNQNFSNTSGIIQDKPRTGPAAGNTKPKSGSRVIRDSNGRFRKVTAEEVAAPAVLRSQSQTPQVRQNSQIRPLVTSRPPGRVVGMLLTIFGGLGTFAFGLASTICMIVGTAGGEPNALFAYLILLPFLVGSITMLSVGNTLRGRINRYRNYVRILNGRSYCMLKEFARGTGKSDRFVLKDIRKMLSLSMFPQGRLDDEGTCLMLNQESYEQYLTLKNSMAERAYIEEEKPVEEEQEEPGDPFLTEVNKSIEEGRNYLKEIREVNREIPGGEISKKLDMLEMILAKIFEQLERHPEKLPEMKKFMEYYLPTTLKLVNVYREFDRQAIGGDNIENGKKEIEKTLDTINKAFLNLFDSLFEDVALDISTDISVLQTMLAQEGLTGSDFS